MILARECEIANYSDCEEADTGILKRLGQSLLPSENTPSYYIETEEARQNICSRYTEEIVVRTIKEEFR